MMDKKRECPRCGEMLDKLVREVNVVRIDYMEEAGGEIKLRSEGGISSWRVENGNWKCPSCGYEFESNDKALQFMKEGI